MRQQEFEARVQMQVSPAEYSHIEAVYMMSDIDKDEFCKLWVKMNKERVQVAIKKEKERREMEAMCNELHSILTKYSFKNYEWLSTTTTYSGLTKKERRVIEKAGMELENGIMPKNMSNMLYEVSKYLKVA